jgi:hypothetical protein
MAPKHVRFSPRFLQEQDFPGSNLIRADHVEKKPVFRGANCSSVALEVRRSTPLWTANLLETLRGKFAPERSSSGVLEARWSKFLPGKSCSWRKSWTKAHTDWRHFNKSSL